MSQQAGSQPLLTDVSFLAKMTGLFTLYLTWYGLKQDCAKHIQLSRAFNKSNYFPLAFLYAKQEF